MSFIAIVALTAGPGLKHDKMKCVAIECPRNKGQGKTFWTTGNEARYKQGRMAIKAVALLVGLVIGSIQFAEAQQSKVYRIGVLTLHTPIGHISRPSRWFGKSRICCWRRFLS